MTRPTVWRALRQPSPTSPWSEHASTRWRHRCCRRLPDSRALDGEPPTVSLWPAWSEVFAADRLEPVPALPLPVPISKEWAFGDSRGSGVTVAVVDSGIDADHPLVGGVEGYAAFTVDESAADGVRVDVQAHADVVGHGTACAGIIRSIAPDVRLVSVRVLGERLSGRSASFAAGLRWALASGVDVISCSLSTSRQENAATFHDIADEAAHAGVVIVCAVNNVAGPSIPATFSSVISWQLMTEPIGGHGTRIRIRRWTSVRQASASRSRGGTA